MKYKITKFTKEEKQDIRERYSEWMKPENVVWVEKEYRNALSDKTFEFGASGLIEINKKIDLYSLIFLKYSMNPNLTRLLFSSTNLFFHCVFNNFKT